eukprot:TRINITY_DN14319_c0_g1_i2.p1 TRINITY_DN14319_c0_g1~~TRINITY_DN14319_c0_g1_i2.p1  ORF type:complete len:330 (+),score=53.70 TRINITY_DN14319_c0_g1_i2:527-1516(+)
MLLPPAVPIAYPVAERWPHQYAPPYDDRGLWVPAMDFEHGRFETLWDPEHWLRTMPRAGVSVAVSSTREPVRRLPDVASVTGCTLADFDTAERCLRHNRSAWEPLRAMVRSWTAVLRNEPPQRWAADALCFQVAPMEGTDQGCAALFGSSICDAAFLSLRPNSVAVAAAALARSSLNGTRWASVHLQEDWECPGLSRSLLRAMNAHGVGGKGSAVFFAGGGSIPEELTVALRRRLVRLVTKDNGLPSSRQRLPYEVAGQVDWLLTSSAPGPFFYVDYTLPSSFDIYAAQERRRNGLPTVAVPLGGNCTFNMKRGFRERERKTHKHRVVR